MKKGRYILRLPSSSKFDREMIFLFRESHDGQTIVKLDCIYVCEDICCEFI